jgi:hypothetical protein
MKGIRFIERNPYAGRFPSRTFLPTLEMQLMKLPDLGYDKNLVEMVYQFGWYRGANIRPFIFLRAVFLF